MDSSRADAVRGSSRPRGEQRHRLATDALGKGNVPATRRHRGGGRQGFLSPETARGNEYPRAGGQARFLLTRAAGSRIPSADYGPDGSSRRTAWLGWTSSWIPSNALPLVGRRRPDANDTALPRVRPSRISRCDHLHPRTAGAGWKPQPPGVTDDARERLRGGRTGLPPRGADRKDPPTIRAPSRAFA